MLLSCYYRTETLKTCTDEHKAEAVSEFMLNTSLR